MNSESSLPFGILAKARALVLQHGWNGTAYQILNPGIHLWFSVSGDAVVGFADWGRVRLAAGSPVCHDSQLTRVMDEFEKDVSHQGLDVCWFAADSRLAKLREKVTGYSKILLGLQPVWDLAVWPMLSIAGISRGFHPFNSWYWLWLNPFAKKQLGSSINC